MVFIESTGFNVHEFGSTGLVFLICIALIKLIVSLTQSKPCNAYKEGICSIKPLQDKIQEDLNKRLSSIEDRIKSVEERICLVLSFLSEMDIGKKK